MKIIIIPTLLAGLVFGAIDIIAENVYSFSKKEGLISDINIAKTIWKSNEYNISYFSLKDNYITYNKGDITADRNGIRCELKATENVIKCYKRNIIK